MAISEDILLENIKKLVYAFDNQIPVKITFPDGSIGPNERIVATSAEDFTMAMSAEQAAHEAEFLDDAKAGDTITCPWEYVKSVELLSA